MMSSNVATITRPMDEYMQGEMVSYEDLKHLAKEHSSCFPDESTRRRKQPNVPQRYGARLAYILGL
jgi:hypothetical protein